jgi:hypothetical protein
MAKIILVTNKLSSTAWPLALSLRDQQHEVVILTSRDQDAEEVDGIRIMRCFKNWSLVEAAKVIPRLFTYEPQILHLILDSNIVQPAHAVLAAYAKSHPLIILTTSLLLLEKRLHPRSPMRLLLQESDIVTCPSVEALAKLRGLNVRSRRQGRGILPPALDLYESSRMPEIEVETNASVTLTHWRARLSQAPFFVMPFLEKSFTKPGSPDAPYFRRLRKVAETGFVVLLGSNLEWPVRQRRLFEQWMDEQGLGECWMFSGDLTSAQENDLLRQCQSLILAGIPLNAEEISQYYLKAIQCNTPLVLDTKQASVHAHLWQRNINCWILNYETLDKELREFLQRDDYHPPESIKDMLSQDRHLTDTPLNELNRLYTRALAQLK